MFLVMAARDQWQISFARPVRRHVRNRHPRLQAARQAEQKAFYEKYPPTTPMIVGNIEEVRIDDKDHELYCTDSYLGGRIMVFDLDTLAFKRGWGAYGHKLSQMSTDNKDRAYTPGGPEPKEFRNHLTLNISNDGLVYAADRGANRIQVFTKDGMFLKEFTLATYTGAGGSAGGVMFSPDKEQRLLYISDLTNNHIWFLNRADGRVHWPDGADGTKRRRVFRAAHGSGGLEGNRLYRRSFCRRTRAEISSRQVARRDA